MRPIQSWVLGEDGSGAGTDHDIVAAPVSQVTRLSATPKKPN